MFSKISQDRIENIHPETNLIPSKAMNPSRCLVGALLLLLPIGAAIAHEVKVGGDVAVLFHITPHHNPKAGIPSQAWFAMTKKGGKVIPLSQCNCKLEIHANPRVTGSQALLTPQLQPVAADRYQGIPGATIVFPKAGEYELELSGTPKKGASFHKFETSYRVVVSAK
jgi:hypothetical protein